MTERSDIENALRASAAAPTPVPDADFVDALERRLTLSAGGGNVVPFAKRARRASAGVVIGATVAFAGVAAAAGIAVTHPFRDDKPGPASTVATTVEPTTGPTTLPLVPTTLTLPVSVPVTLPGSIPVTLPPVTLPVTLPVSGPATPTTEIHVAATMSLTCAPTGTSIRCTWTAGPRARVTISCCAQKRA